MTLTILLATLAFAGIPFALSRLWKSTRTVVYQGAAVPITAGLEDLGQSTNSRYCWFRTDSGEQHLAEISIEQHAKIISSEPATITVVRHLFGRAEVESVTWPYEATPEPAISADMAPMLVTLAYFFAGLGAMAFGFKFENAPGSLTAMCASAFLLALAGFALNLTSGPKQHKRSDISASMLGIPIGKGTVSLVVMFLISLAVTWLCFSSVSFFAFFPGIHAAFALGGVTAIWLKSRHST
ncbi:MAG: hypothetical protein SGJ27_06700 [Candidatus Melainabacteria bacterium]|nr:hypothetical protein [Candidatus Melainabacteria bacterium]